MFNILIDKLEWLDGNLQIHYRSDDDSDMTLYSKKLGEEQKVVSAKQDDSKTAVITFFDKGQKTIFKKGRWRAVSEESLIPAQLSDEIMLNIEDYTRCFYSCLLYTSALPTHITPPAAYAAYINPAASCSKNA